VSQVHRRPSRLSRARRSTRHRFHVPCLSHSADRQGTWAFPCEYSIFSIQQRYTNDYKGFYKGSLPELGGEPALQGFLQLTGRFETGSCATLAAKPIAVIHFIVGGSDEVVTPVPLLSLYLKYFFPTGGYIYLEVPFDVTTHKKISAYTRAQEARFAELKAHLAHGGRVLAFFSDHSEEDSGWLFAGREKGSFVAMSVSQVSRLLFLIFL
jgi:hypothetical protein